MFEFIDKIKDRYRQNRVEKLLNVQKSLSEIDDRIEELSKAQSHKYIRKEPDGKGGFNYIYDEPEISKEQRDKNFKEWFGNSQVVDENGNPLIVYHGTDEDFSEFNKDKNGSSSKVNSGGIFFVDNKKTSKTYGSKIKEVFLSIKNPLVIDFDGKSSVYFLGKNLTPSILSKRVSEIANDIKEGFSLDEDVKEELKQLGVDFFSDDLDGIIMNNVSDTGKYGDMFSSDKANNYVVFSPNQIKSAIGNKGTFDKNSNDITKSINDYISELAQLKLNKNKLLKSEQSLKNEDTLFKSMYNHMRFEATYKEVTKGYRQGQIGLEKCDEILKAINNDKKVKYSDNLVFNTEGKLLLLKRSELDKTFPGMYTIPGGHVDAGEDHRTAAIRELQEESGLTPDKDSQFTKVGEYEDDKVCIEYFLSYVDNDNDTLCLQSEEAWQYEWVDPRELDKYEFPLNMKQNIQKILYPNKEVIVKLGKAYKSNKINKEQFIEAINILNKSQLNHKYIDKKLDKFGNFYYIYKENQNSLNNEKQEENSTGIIENIGTTIISDSIQGCPEEYKGERKASWQLDKLRKEAEEKGFIEDSVQNLKNDSEKVFKGTEAQVMFIKNTNNTVSVLKAFDPLSHLSPKETLDDFINRIDLYNEYFPETSLYFRGVSEDNNKNAILFSQKYIDGNVLKLPDPPYFESFNEAKIRLKEEDRLYKQVASELKKRFGFIPIGKEKTKYTNGKVTIQDVHLGNVMKGIDGKLYFIDLDISKNTEVVQKLGKAFKSGKITREKFIAAVDVLSKSVAQIGETRHWSDGDYKKVANGKWIKVDDKEDVRGGVYNSPEYKTAKIVQNILKERGVDKNFSVSSTDFGNSMYFTIYGENMNEPKLKIRISDHSVGNRDRIFNEQHESSESDPERIADDIELAMYPDHFNKIESGKKYWSKYDKSWVSEKDVNKEDNTAWLVNNPQEMNEKQLSDFENNEYIRIEKKEFLRESKSGNKIYKVNFKRKHAVDSEPIYKYERKENINKSEKNYEELLKKLKERRDPEGIEDKQYTKEEAEYILPFKGISSQMCDRCTYWRKEDNCTKVKGEINPKAHCKFQEQKEIGKSLQSINELYLQNRLSDELYETIIEKAWNKSPIGTITTRSNGQKWKKVSETGNKDQDWQLVGKPKTGNKTDEPVSKEKRAEYGTKGEQPTISEHAKESSETALNNAIKESQDPEVREAAHQELDRRQKEEHVQEEEKKDGREKEGENKHVEKFRQLSDDQIKFYLDAPYPEVKEAAKMVADERGLSVVSKEDYIKSFEDYDSNLSNNISKLDLLREKYKDAQNNYYDNKNKDTEKIKDAVEDELNSFKEVFKKENSKYQEDLNNSYKKEMYKSSQYLHENKEIDDSLDFYKKYGFKDIRDHLSNEKENRDLDSKSDHLSKFINDNKIDRNLSLNRRVLTGNSFFTKLKEGDIYEDKSFSSTSLVQLSEFGDFNIKILAKKGSNVANVNNPGEYEYLIDKNSQFRVIEKQKDGLGITVELL